jgi:hypothetical protein
VDRLASAAGRFAPALLALPFLVGIAVLRGLTVEIDTFHGSDAAIYQLPTILGLRDSLDFSDYPSAQTPLFHVVMAGWGKLVGFELWKLRLLNVAISYGAALALLRLLRRTTSLGPLPALALALAFALSPYFFGASFTLLTDNLAILFALLALERVHRYTQTGSLAAFATACLWSGAAVLTRQSFLWLALVAGAFLVLRERRSLPRLAGGAALLALALAPLAALAIEWNGLVPPSADPLSCGLCTDRPGVGRDALTLRTVGFTVALLGVYAALVLGPGLARREARLDARMVTAGAAGLEAPAHRARIVAGLLGGGPGRRRRGGAAGPPRRLDLAGDRLPGLLPVCRAARCARLPEVLRPLRAARGRAVRAAAGLPCAVGLRRRRARVRRLGGLRAQLRGLTTPE